MAEAKAAAPREVRGPGGRRGMGPRPKVANPGKLLKRLLGFVMRRYSIHLFVVIACILIGVFANVQGTMFMRTLIDVYITPLLGNTGGAPDFAPLLKAIGRVGVFMP